MDFAQHKMLNIKKVNDVVGWPVLWKMHAEKAIFAITICMKYYTEVHDIWRNSPAYENRCKFDSPECTGWLTILGNPYFAHAELWIHYVDGETDICYWQDLWDITISDIELCKTIKIPIHELDKKEWDYGLWRE